MVKINVDGKDYELTEDHEKVMKYLPEAIAMEQGGIKITYINQHTFEFILKILSTLHFQVQEPPKIKQNVLEDIIGKELYDLIGNLTPVELNTLYKAAHFLQIVPLRKCIAAVVASRVFIKPTLEQYNQKKAQIKLQKELNTELSKEYKERFPFIN